MELVSAMASSQTKNENLVRDWGGIICCGAFYDVDFDCTFFSVGSQIWRSRWGSDAEEVGCMGSGERRYLHVVAFNLI